MGAICPARGVNAEEVAGALITIWVARDADRIVWAVKLASRTIDV
jgi:hypothetical protein